MIRPNYQSFPHDQWTQAEKRYDDAHGSPSSPRFLQRHIGNLRRECLVNRVLYYVFASPLLEDFEYDTYERRLRELVKQYPALAAKADLAAVCPTEAVGSSLEDSYPKEIVAEARRRAGL